MPKFKVTIREELVKHVLVDAENLAEAEEKAEEAYNKERYVLDYRDFDGAYFDAEYIDISEYTELAELEGLYIIGEESEGTP